MDIKNPYMAETIHKLRMEAPIAETSVFKVLGHLMLPALSAQWVRNTKLGK